MAPLRLMFCFYLRKRANFDETRKMLLKDNDFFAGSWLEEGERARKITGAVKGAQSQIWLQEPLQKAELEQLYGGKTVRLWQYGIGDSVEIPRLR